MKNFFPLHFMLTGGTIDSYYEGTKDTVVPNAHSIIPRYMKSLKLYNEIVFTEICMKDSREITPKDLHKLIKEIEASKHKQIIITHGTYYARHGAFSRCKFKEKRSDNCYYSSNAANRGVYYV